MSGDKFKIKLGNEVIGIAEDAAIKTVEKQTENFIEIINEYVDDKTLVLYKKIKNKYYFRNKILKLIIEFDKPVNIKYNEPMLVSALLDHNINI